MDKINSEAWLRRGYKHIPKEATEGNLSFDGHTFQFVSIDKNTNLGFMLNDLYLADLNNVMGEN